MKEKRKLSPLKVGQRVLVYDGPLRLIGAKGTVDNVCGHNDLYHIKLDVPTEEADTPLIHARQCVRLKPKKAPAAPERVEMWADLNEKGFSYAVYPKRPQTTPATSGHRQIRMTEIREGERILSRADVEEALARFAEKGSILVTDACKSLGFGEEREP